MTPADERRERELERIAAELRAAGCFVGPGPTYRVDSKGVGTYLGITAKTLANWRLLEKAPPALPGHRNRTRFYRLGDVVEWAAMREEVVKN